MKRGTKHKTDSIVKMRDAKRGYIPWNKGLTKETDLRVKSSWNKGLTKDTDERVKVGADKIIGHLSFGGMTGKHHTQETKDKCREVAIKQWSDPERAKVLIAGILKANQFPRPNKLEQKVAFLLQSISSNIVYVGDFSYKIPGTVMNPDFINKEEHKIIEVFGCFWHGCSKHYPDTKKQMENRRRVNQLKKLGYSVLVIWEHELKNLSRVMGRIKEFDEQSY